MTDLSKVGRCLTLVSNVLLLVGLGIIIAGAGDRMIRMILEAFR